MTFYTNFSAVWLFRYTTSCTDTPLTCVWMGACTAAVAFGKQWRLLCAWEADPRPVVPRRMSRRLTMRMYTYIICTRWRICSDRLVACPEISHQEIVVSVLTDQVARPLLRTAVDWWTQGFRVVSKMNLRTARTCALFNLFGISCPCEVILTAVREGRGSAIVRVEQGGLGPCSMVPTSGVGL